MKKNLWMLFLILLSYGCFNESVKEIVQVKVDIEKSEIKVGESCTIYAKAIYSDESEKVIDKENFHIKDKEIIKLEDNKIIGNFPGNAEIIIKFDGKEKKTNIKVLNGVKEIKTSLEFLKLEVNQIETFEYFIVYEDLSEVKGTELVFSNDEFVKVIENNKIQAIKPGKTKLILKKDEIKKEIEIEVENSLKNIKFNDEKNEFFVKEEYEIITKLIFYDETEIIGNIEIDVVEGNDLIEKKNNLIKFIKPGEVLIKATKDDKSIEKKIVIKNKLVELVNENIFKNMKIGDENEIVAKAIYLDGSEQRDGFEVQVVSGEECIELTKNNVIAVKPGNVTIRILKEHMSIEESFQILNKLEDILLEKEKIELMLNEEVEIKATLLFTDKTKIYDGFTLEAVEGVENVNISNNIVKAIKTGEVKLKISKENIEKTVLLIIEEKPVGINLKLEEDYVFTEKEIAIEVYFIYENGEKKKTNDYTVEINNEELLKVEGEKLIGIKPGETNLKIITKYFEVNRDIKVVLKDYERYVYFKFNVPETTPSDENLYLVGDFNAWNPLDDKYKIERNDEGEYILKLRLKRVNSSIRFKVTRGGWVKEAINEVGTVYDDIRYKFMNYGEKVEYQIYDWKDLKEIREAEYKSGVLKTIEINAPSLEGNLLNDKTNRYFTVYLPPTYNESEKKYPVLYYLAGFGDSHQRYVDFSYTGKGNINELISEEKIGEMIIVYVDSINLLMGSFYVNSPVHGNWMDFITEDLLLYVDANYRTIKDKSGRGIAGHSMGGFGAINIAMQNSDKYGFMYAQAPGLIDEDGFFDTAAGNERVAREFIKFQDNIEGLSDAKSRSRFLGEVSSFKSGSYKWESLFLYAYSSAFAPLEKAPYFEHPYYLENDEIKVNNELLDKMNEGFGNLKQKVEKYKEDISKYSYFVIEYGVRDYYSFIPTGCEYFSKVLKDNGLEHSLKTHSGGHEDNLSTRMKNYLFTDFSDFYYKD